MLGKVAKNIIAKMTSNPTMDLKRGMQQIKNAGISKTFNQHDAARISMRNGLENTALGAGKIAVPTAGAAGAGVYGYNKFSDQLPVGSIPATPEDAAKIIQQHQLEMDADAIKAEHQRQLDAENSLSNQLSGSIGSARDKVMDISKAAADKLNGAWDSTRSTVSDLYNQLDNATGGHAALTLGLGIPGALGAGIGAVHLARKMRKNK